MDHGSQLEEALALVSRHRWQAAKRILQPYIQAHPNDFQALVALGRVLNALRTYGGARKMYRRALALDPDRDEVWRELLAIDSNLQALSKDAEKAVARFPDNTEFARIRLDCLAILGKRSEVERLLDDMIVEAPDHEQTWLIRADVYSQFAMGQVAPHEPAVINELGFRQSLAVTKELLRCFQNALACNPDNYRAALQQSRLLRLLGRYDQAEQLIQQLKNRVKDDDVLTRVNQEANLVSAGEEGRRETLASVYDEQAAILSAEANTREEGQLFEMIADDIRMGKAVDEIMADIENQTSADETDQPVSDAPTKPKNLH